jgi:hypothetical protein
MIFSSYAVLTVAQKLLLKYGIPATPIPELSKNKGRRPKPTS